MRQAPGFGKSGVEGPFTVHWEGRVVSWRGLRGEKERVGKNEAGTVGQRSFGVFLGSPYKRKGGKWVLEGSGPHKALH